MIKFLFQAAPRDFGSLNNATTSEEMLKEVVSDQMTIEDNLDEATDEEMLTEISAKMTKELLDLFGTEEKEEKEEEEEENEQQQQQRGANNSSSCKQQ